MAEYYAVERSPEYLAHYGIRGMKWGVRKAARLMTMNDKASQKRGQQQMNKQYAKAQKKLAKLNKKADIGEQKQQQMKYAKRAAIGLGVSAAGVGGIFGAQALKNVNRDKYNKAVVKLMSGTYKHGIPADAKSVETFVSNHPVATKHLNTYQDRARALSDAKIISGAVDIGGLAYGGYAGARSLAAKYRQTKKGHAKAVAKRNEFQREMNKAFASTKYAKKKRK